MTSENPKSPFMVTADIMTHTKSGHPPGVIHQTVRADTIRELKSQMDGVEAVVIGQSKELGKKMTVTFGPIMQLDPETGGRTTFTEEVRKKRGWLSRLFGAK